MLVRFRQAGSRSAVKEIWHGSFHTKSYFTVQTHKERNHEIIARIIGLNTKCSSRQQLALLHGEICFKAVLKQQEGPTGNNQMWTLPQISNKLDWVPRKNMKLYLFSLGCWVQNRLKSITLCYKREKRENKKSDFKSEHHVYLQVPAPACKMCTLLSEEKWPVVILVLSANASSTASSSQATAVVMWSTADCILVKIQPARLIFDCMCDSF